MNSLYILMVISAVVLIIFGIVLRKAWKISNGSGRSIRKKHFRFSSRTFHGRRLSSRTSQKTDMDAGIKVILIAAMAKNSRVIGREGKVPWNLSDDLKAFKKLTLGKTVIVGRKTQDSIIARLGHPLSNRRTIVLTRDKNYQCQDCDTASSWAEALKLAKNEKEVFVLGGS